MLKKLDGYKTPIGVIAYALLQIVAKMGYVEGPMYGIIQGVIGMWTGVSVAHHLYKRKTNKGTL